MLVLAWGSWLVFNNGYMTEIVRGSTSEKLSWVNSRIQRTCLLLALGTFDRPATMQQILGALPDEYARLCEDTLRKDAEADCEENSLRMLKWGESDHVGADPDPIEPGKYFLTEAGMQYCEAILEKYEAAPADSPHIGNIVSHLLRT